MGVMVSITKDDLARLEERVRKLALEKSNLQPFFNDAALVLKNEELEHMNKLFVGRELRMVELKENLRRLKAEVGGMKPAKPGLEKP